MTQAQKVDSQIAVQSDKMHSVWRRSSCGWRAGGFEWQDRLCP